MENDVENIFTYICKGLGGAYIPDVDMKQIATEVMRVLIWKNMISIKTVVDVHVLYV